MLLTAKCFSASIAFAPSALDFCPNLKFSDRSRDETLPKVVEPLGVRSIPYIADRSDTW